MFVKEIGLLFIRLLAYFFARLAATCLLKQEMIAVLGFKIFMDKMLGRSFG